METGEKRKIDTFTDNNQIEREEKLPKIESTNANEIVVPFNFEEDKCDYIIITKDKNIKLPAEFLQYVCEDFANIPKEIDFFSMIPGDEVLEALKFYIPRSVW